jgi:hypothetical protein
MIAFIVSVNREKVCRIALESDNGRSVNLVWGGDPEEGLFLHLGGMDGNEYHVRWNVPNIRIGDEVTIKIGETDACDPPTARKSVERLAQ